MSEAKRIPIKVERKGKYLVVRHGATVQAFRIVWQHDHGERREDLTFIPLEALPRELEYLYQKA